MRLRGMVAALAVAAAFQGAAASAGDGREALAHVAPVSEARPEKPLAALVPVGASVAAVAALGSGERTIPVKGAIVATVALTDRTVAVGGNVARSVALASASAGVDGAVPGVGPVTQTAGSVMLTVPTYKPVAATTALDVDPFLWLFDVWIWGPLGEVRQEALAARARGDQERFDIIRRSTGSAWRRHWSGARCWVGAKRLGPAAERGGCAAMKTGEEYVT